MEVELLSHDKCDPALRMLRACSGSPKSLITIAMPFASGAARESLAGQLYKYASEIGHVGNVPSASRKSREWASKVVTHFSQNLPALTAESSLILFVGHCTQGAGAVEKCYIIPPGLGAKSIVPKGYLKIDNRFSVAELEQLVAVSGRVAKEREQTECRDMLVRFRKERARPPPNLSEVGLEEALSACRQGAVECVLLDSETAARMVCVACFFPWASGDDPGPECANCGGAIFKDALNLLSAEVPLVRVIDESAEFEGWGADLLGCVAILRFRTRW